MTRYEHVLGDEGNTAACSHAGNEPGVVAFKIRHRDERQTLVDGLAGVVNDRHAKHRPLSMPTTGIVVPLASNPKSTFYLARCRTRCQHARDARIRIRAEDFVLCLERKEARKPTADVVEVHHPGSATVCLCDCCRHVEHGTRVHFPTTISLGSADLEQASLRCGLNGFLFDAPACLTLRRVLPKQRSEFACPSHELIGCGYSNIMNACDVGHCMSPPSRVSLFAFR